jgi:hypothetical protein
MKNIILVLTLIASSSFYSIAQDECGFIITDKSKVTIPNIGGNMISIKFMNLDGSLLAQSDFNWNDLRSSLPSVRDGAQLNLTPHGLKGLSENDKWKSFFQKQGGKLYLGMWFDIREDIDVETVKSLRITPGCFTPKCNLDYRVYYLEIYVSS